MKTDIFTEYYNYKIKTVYQYSILLTKIIGIDKNKLWHKKKDVNDTLDEIIKNYFNKMINPSETNQNLVNCFINYKDISKYNIEKEILCVIDYFINHNRGLEIPAYQKEIILAASIINISNRLDISTSPYKVNKNNYNTIVNTLIEQFNKIDFFNLIDDGKKNIKMLTELVKTNVRKERKIFELLSSNISFNKYVDISAQNRYYLSQYNYSVPGLNKFDSYASKKVYEESGIDDKFVAISADLIIVSLMKQLSVRSPLKTFFLPIKASFFDTDKNIKDIKYIFENKSIRKNVVVLINYADYNDNIKNAIKRYRFEYYIYCSKNSKVEENKLDCQNYLVSKDFCKANKDLITTWKTNGINIIIEDFDGVVTDKAIVE